MIQNFVKIVRCSSALDFVSALSPTGAHFIKDLPNSWLYRGHAHSNFKLVPSALRSSTSMQSATVSEADTNKRQVQYELEILKNFFEIADWRGLFIPEDSQSLRELIHDIYESSLIGFENLTENDISWPPKELLSLTGIAQHYGLPTRLLDWTYDSYIAAFFAAKGVMNFENKKYEEEDLIRRYCSISGNKFHVDNANIAISGNDRKLCVWAFSTLTDIAFQYNPTELAPYEIVNVPYASNPNIGAQKGLFTVRRVPIQPKNVVDRRSFDDVLGETAKSMELEPDKTPLFIRFELDWTHASELIRLLAKLGISSSSIFPGFKGACDSVSERPLWLKSNTGGD